MSETAKTLEELHSIQAEFVVVHPAQVAAHPPGEFIAVHVREQMFYLTVGEAVKLAREINNAVPEGAWW